MKRITILFLLLAIGTYAGAQALDTVRIVSKARRFNPSQYIMIMFELKDTVDASGKNVSMSRSYYFDNQSRMMSSVRESDNPKKPERGRQVIYSFAQNKLSAVTIIPSRSTCRNCATRYFYSNDTVSSKEENRYTNVNPAIFAKQAQYFQSKVPHDLPWGYFDNEVIINGKSRKVKRSY